MAGDSPKDVRKSLETRTVSPFPPDRPPPSDTLPDSIGKYSIKRVIASGGMGIVYEARQENPRRAVAVKVMNRGVASKSAMRRFEFEAQVLGRLRHPGIAQIYEAGTHSAGGVDVPYFAMEYIPNAQTITQFAFERRLNTRERLKLFAQVCEAVHHGHQKGVIHRDLKPSNILVDSSGQVKIIDFGVARGTDSDLALTTQQTDMGQLIGTLQYMSPEQVQADPNDIDTRSDVYALGVVLFELLTERLPYDVREVAIHEATRVIREGQPTRLSLINKTLRGDVETIALKALEKDRTRRYQSASDFGMDIQRYLSNEPIAARPPSMVYRLGKFVRRRRVPLAMAAVVALALGVGVDRQIRANQSESLLRTRETAYGVFMAAQPDEVLRNPVKVIWDCTRAIEMDSNLSLAYALRAKAYLLSGNDAKAWEDARKAVEIDPQNAYAQRALAHLYTMKGEFEQARDAYEKGFQKFLQDADLPRDLHNRAMVHSALGDHQLALAFHDGAVAFAPRKADAYMSRGLTKRFAGEEAGAIDDFRRGANLKPELLCVRAGLWTWEILLLRGRESDRGAAETALAEAEKTANVFEKSLFSALRNEISYEQLAPLARNKEELSCAEYYLGVKALIEGRKEDARSLFEASLERNLYKLPEYELARWHLSRF